MRVRFRRKSGARGRNLSVLAEDGGNVEVREVEDPVSGDFVGFSRYGTCRKDLPMWSILR